MKKEFNIKILVADDHYVVRMGVIAIINDEPDMEVVAEAANGVQAIELFKKHKPDLALLDSRMPLKGGVQAAKEIKNFSDTARIVMLTAYDGDEDIFQALESGALGYVLKIPQINTSSPQSALWPLVKNGFRPKWRNDWIREKLTSLSLRGNWSSSMKWPKAWRTNKSQAS